MLSVPKICIHVLFFFVNVVEGVEEEDFKIFNGAVPWDSSRETPRGGFGSRGGPAADLKAVAVVMVEVVEVDF